MVSILISVGVKGSIPTTAQRELLRFEESWRTFRSGLDEGGVWSA